MQLWTRMNLHRVMLGFLEHVGQEEQMAWVNDFTATVDAIIAAVDVEEILYSGV